MIRIGVLGAGHLGKIHIKLLKEIPDFELVGFFDLDNQTSQEVASEFDIKSFDSLEQLLDAVEAVDIVVPTLDHYKCAKASISHNKHTFIEKPVTNTMEESMSLLNFCHEHKVVVQIGHVERFNPAFLAIENQEVRPMFIEGHRLAQYNPRGTDVSVVLDLMIHDLDIIHSLIPYPVEKVSASGVAVVSHSPDIANARILFHNGAVANLTASRISMKNMRKLRLFQPQSYLSLDFLEKKVEAYKIIDKAEANGNPFAMPIDQSDDPRYLKIEMPEVKQVNSIKMELEEFAAAIRGERKPRVSLLDGHRALETAHTVLREIKKSLAEIELKTEL